MVVICLEDLVELAAHPGVEDRLASEGITITLYMFMALESTFGISLTHTTGKGKLLLLAVQHLSPACHIDFVKTNDNDKKINLRKTPSQLGLGQAIKEESDPSNLCSTADLTIFLITFSSDSKGFMSSTTNGEPQS